MDNLAQALTDWHDTLCPRVEVGGLISRNPTAHKWKATFRSLVVRETVCWRTQDLLSQSFFLWEADKILGSRILLRSAFETLAILVYLNQLMRKVVSGAEDFHEFSDKTARLLLGSKDGSTSHQAVNILTVLKKCEDRFPGIEKLYAVLSESAHPNFEGICLGYATDDKKDYVTSFSNKWSEVYRESQRDGIAICIAMFAYEYNDEWRPAFEALEQWIVVNDSALERTKRSASV